VIAEEFIDKNRAAWKSRQYEHQWRQTLEDYVLPIFGNVPVNAIDAWHIRLVLDEIWQRVPDTAMKTRGRIDQILSYAASRGYRNGKDNSARWRGHLEHSFKSPRELRPTRHHEALPHAEMPAFMAELIKHSDERSRALAFVILTACRSGEVTGADWSEFDLANRIWTIPAARMKAAAEHRVPLSEKTLALLGEPGIGKVFPGIARNALMTRLRRMHPTVRVHGFRSSFHDWASEETDYPEVVIEMSLAHRVGDSTVRAYRRTDLFAKRRALMEEWVRFCCTPPAANVVPLRA
jgi:integrase